MRSISISTNSPTAKRSLPSGWAREATVEQFPISEGVAGVDMTLEPGGVRELHWHAIAAEWAFMLEGHARITILDPEGKCEVADFGPGDVWYFPKATAIPFRRWRTARILFWRSTTPFLRIRHLQHHRLGGAYAERGIGKSVDMPAAVFSKAKQGEPILLAAPFRPPCHCRKTTAD